MLDLEYIEIDGILYQNIETGIENLEGDLRKYGILRLRYLHEHRREMYLELLMSGKLAEHCRAVDKTVFKHSERIQADWLAAHLVPHEVMLGRTQLRIQAQAIVDETMLTELIYTKKIANPRTVKVHGFACLYRLS